MAYSVIAQDFLRNWWTNMSIGCLLKWEGGSITGSWGKGYDYRKCFLKWLSKSKYQVLKSKGRGARAIQYWV